MTSLGGRSVLPSASFPSVVTDLLSSGGLAAVVCTNTASEGLNLEAAAALVNYDLPWNPSRVEQQIGRIGQKVSRGPHR